MPFLWHNLASFFRPRVEDRMRMKYAPLVGLGLVMVASGVGVLAAGPQAQAPRAVARPASPTGTPSIAVTHTPSTVTDAQTALVKQYCAGCHNDRGKERAGNLSLASFDAARVGQDPQVAETAEKMIRKLRLGMMPPAG